MKLNPAINSSFHTPKIISMFDVPTLTVLKMSCIELTKSRVDCINTLLRTQMYTNNHTQQTHIEHVTVISLAGHA